MAEDLQRKNELDLIKIQGEIRLLSERIDVIKNNDLHHLQKSLDISNRTGGYRFKIVPFRIGIKNGYFWIGRF